ncbi:unnamed protein product [Amoebophrya sp. A120]|nr:unnamed protein product [Amoebophrya sp. A120]|eukprot:GSA120T00017111001.1
MSFPGATSSCSPSDPLCPGPLTPTGASSSSVSSSSSSFAQQQPNLPPYGYGAQQLQQVQQQVVDYSGGNVNYPPNTDHGGANDLYAAQQQQQQDYYNNQQPPPFDPTQPPPPTSFPSSFELDGNFSPDQTNALSFFAQRSSAVGLLVLCFAALLAISCFCAFQARKLPSWVHRAYVGFTAGIFMHGAIPKVFLKLLWLWNGYIPKAAPIYYVGHVLVLSSLYAFITVSYSPAKLFALGWSGGLFLMSWFTRTTSVIQQALAGGPGKYAELSMGAGYYPVLHTLTLVTAGATGGIFLCSVMKKRSDFLYVLGLCFLYAFCIEGAVAELCVATTILLSPVGNTGGDGQRLYFILSDLVTRTLDTEDARIIGLAGWRTIYHRRLVLPFEGLGNLPDYSLAMEANMLEDYSEVDPVMDDAFEPLKQIADRAFERSSVLTNFPAFSLLFTLFSGLFLSTLLRFSSTQEQERIWRHQGFEPFIVLRAWKHPPPNAQLVPTAHDYNEGMHSGFEESETVNPMGEPLAAVGLQPIPEGEQVQAATVVPVEMSYVNTGKKNARSRTTPSAAPAAEGEAFDVSSNALPAPMEYGADDGRGEEVTLLPSGNDFVPETAAKTINPNDGVNNVKNLVDSAAAAPGDGTSSTTGAELSAQQVHDYNFMMFNQQDGSFSDYTPPPGAGNMPGTGALTAGGAVVSAGGQENPLGTATFGGASFAAPPADGSSGMMLMSQNQQEVQPDGGFEGQYMYDEHGNLILQYEGNDFYGDQELQIRQSAAEQELQQYEDQNFPKPIYEPSACSVAWLPLTKRNEKYVRNLVYCADSRLAPWELGEITETGYLTPGGGIKTPLLAVGDRRQQDTEEAEHEARKKQIYEESMAQEKYAAQSKKGFTPESGPTLTAEIAEGSFLGDKSSAMPTSERGMDSIVSANFDPDVLDTKAFQKFERKHTTADLLPGIESMEQSQLRSSGFDNE